LGFWRFCGRLQPCPALPCPALPWASGRSQTTPDGKSRPDTPSGNVGVITPSGNAVASTPDGNAGVF